MFFLSSWIIKQLSWPIVFFRTRITCVDIQWKFVGGAYLYCNYIANDATFICKLARFVLVQQAWDDRKKKQLIRKKEETLIMNISRSFVLKTWEQNNRQLFLSRNCVTQKSCGTTKRVSRILKIKCHQIIVFMCNRIWLIY